MKKLFTFIVGAAVSLGAYSQDFDSGDLRYTVLDPDEKTCSVTGHYGLSWGIVLEIPESVVYEGDEYTVEALSNDAFWNCNELAGVVIPNSVKEIGNSCFCYSYSLRRLELGTSVQVIKSRAFIECPLETVVANGETPAECEDGYSNVFSSNPLVAVNENAIAAYQTAWEGANVVANIPAESLVFDPTNYTVQPGGTVQLNWVTTPENAPVKFINNYEGVISVDSNGLVTADKLRGGFGVAVEAMTLNGLTAQSYISIESLEEFSIDGLVYAVIPGTENEAALIRYESENAIVNIPETVEYNGGVYSVTTIAPEAFNWNSTIEEVVIPASISVIRENNFNYCQSLKKVTISDSSASLQLYNYTITDNRNLKELYVGRNLTYADGAICIRWNNNLSQLVLGPQVTELPDYIFLECYNLSIVQSKNPVPPTLGRDVFSWNSFSIIVPAESVEAYKEAWSQYAGYITEAVDATSLYFDKDEVTLYNGQGTKLNLTVEPEDATVFFSSSNTNLISVDNEGNIYYDFYRSETGEAIITASTLNGLTTECKVTAKHWLTFSEDNVGLTPGSTFQAVVTKADALAEETVTWDSTNKEIVTVDDNGLITAVAYGEAEVYAQVNVPELYNSYTATMQVKVYAVPTSITAEQTEISVFEDRETSIYLTIEPQDEPDLNRNVTWTVADPEIAEVVTYWDNSYSVRGLKPGVTTITGETVNGLTVELNVTVKAQIEEIKFATDRMYLGVGQSKQLEFTTVPEVTYQTFSYSSDNEDVVTVDADGVVTAHNLGYTDIRISFAGPWGERSTWYPVEVVVLPESVRFAGSSDVEGQINSWTYFQLEFTPDDPEVCRHIDWTAEDPEIANIDSNDNSFWGKKFGTTAMKGVAVNGDVLEGTISITGIEFTVDGEPIRNKEVTLGDEFQVGVNVYPEDLLANISYYSSDDNIATVTEDGTVKAVGYGRTWINASSWIAINENDRKNYSGGFEVIVRPTEGIALSKESVVLKPNSWGNYVYLVSAPDVELGEVTWTSSDYDVVSFDWSNSSEANLRYVGPGVATITATDQNGNVAECQVTCLGLGLSVNGEPVNNIDVAPGDQFQIEVQAYPEDLLSNLTFESYNSSVATVDEYGHVNALTYGTAYIRAYSWTDYEGETIDFSRGIEVAVRPNEGIAFNTNSIVMGQGEYKYLSLASAADVETGDIYWTSSDANIVEITWTSSNEAELHYVGPGVATITATDQNGNVAECKVTCLGLQPTVGGVPVYNVDVVPGEQIKIDVQAYPEELLSNLSFESYNPSVATVSEDGYVDALAYGTAYINISSWADYEGERLDFSRGIEVAVRPYYGIVFNTNRIVMRQGDYSYLQLTSAAGLETGEISWSISDANVVEFNWWSNNSAELRYVGPGRATITATDQNGNVAECEVLCVELSMSESYILMGIDQTREIHVNVLPEGVDVNVDWYSSDYGVAYVSDNVVTPTGYGTAQIDAYVSTSDGIGLGWVSATVEVIDWVYVSDIKLNPEKIVISEPLGETVQITATVLPYDANDKTLSWTTSNSSVAIVDENGVVTIVGHGYAVITASATDGSGVTATCVVGEPVKSITLSETTAIISEGETISLFATVSPSNVADRSVIWSSDRPNIASVDAYGNVRALKAGVAIITATAADGSGVSADCNVIVVPNEVPEIPVAVESIELSQSEWEAKVGETLQLTATAVPSDATNQQVEWMSSDESVATVSYDGVVTAVGTGEAIVTAWILDNMTEVKAECLVKVSDLSSSPSDSNAVSSFEGDDNTLYDVFTQQGILLRRNCTASDIKQLQPGIYIIRSGSTVKTVYLRN